MEENNKIIAEFMGWSTHPKHGDKYLINKSKDRVNLPWYSECNWEASLREFNYHSDWNVLMPVIEKIENTKIKDYSISTDITDDKTFISVWHYGDGGKWSILISNLNEEYKDFNKMQRTYKAVVKFINFYNKQKEE